MEQQTLPLVSERKTIKRLSLKEQHALNGFIEKEYVNSKLTDVEFAEKASTFLSLPGVNARHIASSREIFSIPSNRDVARVEKLQAVSPEHATRLDSFDKRLTTTEAQIRKLFALSERRETRYTDEQITQKWEELYQKHSAASGAWRVLELVRWVRGEVS